MIGQKRNFNLLCQGEHDEKHDARACLLAAGWLRNPVYRGGRRQRVRKTCTVLRHQSVCSRPRDPVGCSFLIFCRHIAVTNHASKGFAQWFNQGALGHAGLWTNVATEGNGCFALARRRATVGHNRTLTTLAEFQTVANVMTTTKACV